MRFLSKIIALTIVLFLSISSTFAIEAPVNLEASDINETSLTLSWDIVDSAFGYHIYYSETQGVEILSAQKKEYVTDIPLVIDGLNMNTQYYFLISAFNEEGEESIFSEEVSFTTTNLVEAESEMNASQDFKLAGIEVLAQNQISLEFTSPLEDTDQAQREFKVVEKDDELNIFYIKESNIDPENSKKILVKFEETLPVSTEFTLTVIDILDINGRNIESGIESFENFYLDESFLDVIVEDALIVDIQGVEDTTGNQSEQTDTVDVVTGEVIVPNQDTITVEGGENTTDNQSEQVNSVEPVTGETISDSDDTIIKEGGEAVNIDPVTGKIMESGEIGIDLHSAGSDAKVLPATGPEHVLMFIIALVFGAMAFVFKFRKA